MQEPFTWLWIEAQTACTIELWHHCGANSPLNGPRFRKAEQRKRENAYDKALRAVERDAKRSRRSSAARTDAQRRVVASFARFSAEALDLRPEAVHLLTDDFLPIGTGLARWARAFDPSLTRAEIVQACRNAWTACGLQPLFGESMKLTSSILGYSLLYPYSDNFLDRKDVSAQAKLHFSGRFRERLRGEAPEVSDDREAALWSLVAMIEDQYPREEYPQVFDCLLAIHQAQEDSIAQLDGSDDLDDRELLRTSVAKGGSSVLADACLARGWLNAEEERFAFEWGVLLQLGDDLQDLREDIARGSATLFSRAAVSGRKLDSLALQLFAFGERVAAGMDTLPNDSACLKDLLRMSWRNLILRAIADTHEFFSDEFLAEAQARSPFRFDFLRARQKRMLRRQGLYATLFEAFLDAPNDCEAPPVPERRLVLVQS
jgi:hypothetical protein